MSVVGSTSILLLFGLGFLISLFAVVVVVVIVAAVVRKSGKSRPAYVPQEQVTPQQEEIRKTLGETLKELRTERNMTQEFVAESLGVSRQAVSKWENGTSEPSTSNLIAIAKLYDIPPEELLKKLI